MISLSVPHIDNPKVFTSVKHTDLGKTGKGFTSLFEFDGLSVENHIIMKGSLHPALERLEYDARFLRGEYNLNLNKAVDDLR